MRACVPVVGGDQRLVGKAENTTWQCYSVLMLARWRGVYIREAGNGSIGLASLPGHHITSQYIVMKIELPQVDDFREGVGEVHPGIHVNAEVGVSCPLSRDPPPLSLPLKPLHLPPASSVPFCSRYPRYTTPYLLPYLPLPIL